MTHPVSLSDSQLRAALEAVGQGHVFRFWDQLAPSQRAELIADLRLINVAQLPNLARLAASETKSMPAQADLQPASVKRRASISADIVRRGEALLAAGKVAAFIVAGGQGTRLGFDGPKGAFPISPVQGKTLFQLFAESILATIRTYGGKIHWYVMTSPANHDATCSCFESNDFYGLGREGVSFFQQGVMPAFDRSGKILLDQPHRIALSPDGHGGSLLALATSGMLADMAARGVDHLSYFQVDNPLVHCLDPAFLGLHDASGSEMSSKTLPKADDLEKVGNFAAIDGALTVIEYSDFPDALARMKNSDGTRRFDAANIAIHALSRAFIERLTADPAAFALPWHRAVKRVPFVDLESGVRVEPTEPNAIKLESFVFDALPLSRNPVLMETSREEEFSPVKNATGIDSVDTAKRDISLRAARWLKSAGVQVPVSADGSPDGVFEISPLLALNAQQLAERRPLPGVIKPGSRIYLGPNSLSAQ
ncbi:hypothetical protein B7486_02710 [cyanobacterium TDX16]|nr:hypothetical protein B7486_02710 [cyanobacterium TDX16]